MDFGKISTLIRPIDLTMLYFMVTFAILSNLFIFPVTIFVMSVLYDKLENCESCESSKSECCSGAESECCSVDIIVRQRG